MSKERRAKHRKSRGTGKGALIKGMTKRLPHEILDNRLFERRLREIMRGYAGIYALYRKSRLYYVGLPRTCSGESGGISATVTLASGIALSSSGSSASTT